jgi:hypothetical protein
VTERLKVHDWKSCGRVKLPRGFESHPLRFGFASPGCVIGPLACPARVAGLFLARRAPRDAGGYAGFLVDEGEERARAAYPGSTWHRLAAIKARYDPGNVFRLNQNIPPAVD